MSLLGLMVIGVTAAYGSQTSQPKMNGKLKVTTLSPEEICYTGKPYSKELGAYVFNYRNYDPQTSRWTTPDPSGFPDGANNQVYTATPTTDFDPNGWDVQDYTEDKFQVDSKHNWDVKAQFTVTFTPTSAPIAGGNARATGDGDNTDSGKTYSFADGSIVIDPSLAQLMTDSSTGKHYWDFSVRFYATYKVSTQSTTSIVGDFFGLPSVCDSTHTFSIQVEQTYHITTHEFE